MAGEERARNAASLVDAFGKETYLASLLSEVFMRARGLQYQAGDTVNGVPVDFTVQDGGGLSAWRIWSTPGALAAGRAADSRIKGAVVRGFPVMRVVHLLANDIYSGDGELEKARVGGMDG